MAKKVYGIRRKTLRMILEASKDTYPKEFAAILRAEEGVIEEILLLPGTVSGDVHAIFQLHMLPIDFSVVGTIHSHPSGSYRPSDADRFPPVIIIPISAGSRSCTSPTISPSYITTIRSLNARISSNSSETMRIAAPASR